MATLMPDWSDVAEALADRFRVELPIGQGGMSTVYLAHDLRHDRAVAIKVLRNEISATVGAARFEREIRIVAGMTHPNILPLHDSGTVTRDDAASGALLYYVMPYVEGASLRAKLESGPLPVGEATQIVEDVGRALSFAHRQGIIHRDVKPDNVLLAEGRAMVTDFGLARALASVEQALTQSGFVVGTPAYMSPEQAAGDPSLDARVDQYGLACTLYELLSGRPPYLGKSIVDVLGMHVSGAVPSVRDLRPSVPQHVEAAVRKAMSKQRDHRFADIDEFVLALEQAPGTDRGWLAKILGR